MDCIIGYREQGRALVFIMYAKTPQGEAGEARNDAGFDIMHNNAPASQPNENEVAA